ncbi:MAG: branched-chain amino acid ABC transporter permease [Hyphomicrobium aestuarii]|nr:branched-chain amino acid ABC transporter permease [Hyphomicrobium aestuarii]
MQDWITIVAAQTLSGLTNAMFLFLMASGLSLIFGVMRILNFAHGSFYMIGAYLAYELTQRAGGSGNLSFLFAALGSGLIVAALAVVIERVALRHLYGREPLAQLLFTYALVLAATDLVKLIWGTQQLSVSRPPALAGSIEIGPLFLPVYNLFIILLGLSVAIGIWAALKLTSFGRLIRAAALDREMLQLLGARVPYLFTGVFAFGAFLAGISGALVAPVTAIVPGMDAEVTMALFIIVVVGGLGSFWGTFVGSILYGIVLSFGILVMPRFSLFAVAALMAIVLIVKPTGLFGREVTR